MRTEIGDIEFWNTVIQDYKDKAKKERSLKRRIRIAKCLNDARGYLKYAEGKILHKTVMVLALVVILFVLGCQTFKGVTGDAGWLLTEMSDNITVQEK